MMNKLTRRGGSLTPVWGLSNLHKDLDSLFETFLQPTTTGSFDFSPPCDIEETNNHYEVKFDLPGVKKEDIKLEVRDNQLFVSGEKREEKKTTEGKSHISERFYGSFSRSFTLPTQVDNSKVEAVFKDGVLEIRIPKSETAKAKKIAIS